MQYLDHQHRELHPAVPVQQEVAHTAQCRAAGPVVLRTASSDVHCYRLYTLRAANNTMQFTEFVYNCDFQDRWETDLVNFPNSSRPMRELSSFTSCFFLRYVNRWSEMQNSHLLFFCQQHTRNSRNALAWFELFKTGTAFVLWLCYVCR